MEDSYTKRETKLFKKLDSSKKIQDFLTFKIKHNPAKDGVECRSPREVLKLGKAHCMEGALLAAAILEFHGHKPLLMDLRSTDDDLDHVVALFRQFGCWGAISKTNHMVLRYREPVYRSIRELALSYFHEYFLDSGKKTLREYSVPFDLRYFDIYLPSTFLIKGGKTADSLPLVGSASLPAEALAKEGEGVNWRTTGKDLAEAAEILDRSKHYKILNHHQLKNLRKADPIEIQAGKLLEWQDG